jgi:hypothetical protein
MASALTTWMLNFNPDGSRRPARGLDTRTHEQVYGSSRVAIARPLAPAAEAESGRLPPPAAAEAAAAQTPLNAPQQAMAIGEPIPVVFCRRRNDAGGVLLFPKATEAAFSNTSTQQTARYHCVLGIGPMGSVQVRDFRVGACRVGTFSQNADRRAGTWSPGNTATAQSGYQVPTFPTTCGGGGDYQGLVTLEFSNTTTGGTDDWRTGCNVFQRDGLTVTRLLDSTSGPSDNIADLVLWAWQRSSRVPAAMIDTASLTAAARFCDVNGLFCNGEFTESANLGDWLIGILPYFLLRETRIGGKFGLRPLLPTNSDGTIYTDTIAPDWVFGESVIAPDSFSQEWSDAGTRLAPKLTMLWRQQSEVDMPIVRSLQVGIDRAGPAEQHDLSRFCATEIHAARVGAYMHGRRYLSTHTAAVTLIPGSHSGRISQGDIVVIRLPLVTGREADGLISDWYAVESVAPSADGSEALTLSHFPVDSMARSLLALQVANATAPGALLPFPAIGACDVAGRSTNTSVPASSTSGTSFRSGGSGISAIPSGGYGGGSYDAVKLPDSGPPSEEAPKSPPVNPGVPGGLPTPPGEPRNPPDGYQDLCPNGFWGLTLNVAYLIFSGQAGVFSWSYSGLSRNVRSFVVESTGVNTYELTSPSEFVTVESYTLKMILNDGTTETIQNLKSSPGIRGEEYPLKVETDGYRCLLDNGSPGPPEVDRRYSVRRGDTLYDIARRLLGNPNRWPEIYERNRDKIEDPDLIYPGQVLRIPAT